MKSMEIRKLSLCPLSTRRQPRIGPRRNGCLEDNRLRIRGDLCPNLVAEAGLYHYDQEARGKRGKKPVDEDNRAMDAMHYLIATLDRRRIALWGKKRLGDPEPAAPPKPRRKHLSIYNEALWTPVTTIYRS
jgi:hypothetical protein